MSDKLSSFSSPLLLLKIAVLTLLTLLVLSCSQREPIKIGYVASLTGRHSELGIRVRNAVLLGIKTINDSGGINGRSLELIPRDDKDDPEHVGTVVKELIEMQVPVIFGPLLSKMAAPTLGAIEGEDVLVISPTISTDQISNIDDNFLRLIPNSSFQGESISEAVLATDLQRLAIVYDGANGAYTMPIYNTFRKRMFEGNRSLCYVSDLSGGQENNMFSVAEEIIKADCQGLFMITSAIDAAELCQQLWKKDKTIRTYGASWVKTGRVIEIGGRSVEGMILATIFEREKKTERYKDFAVRLKSLFGDEPTFASVYAYEAVMLMAHGMQASNSFEAKKIKEAILKQSEFEGLEETFQINPFGDVIRSKSLVQISDGQYMRINP